MAAPHHRHRLCARGGVPGVGKDKAGAFDERVLVQLIFANLTFTVKLVRVIVHFNYSLTVAASIEFSTILGSIHSGMGDSLCPFRLLRLICSRPSPHPTVGAAAHWQFFSWWQ